jgi:hypothetical protein
VLAAQPAGPVKFVVGALRQEAGLDLENRWKIGPFAHTCASVVVISMGPSVVGRDWSPVSSNKARRGYCCRTSCRPSSPIAAEACSPAVCGIYVYVVAHHEPTPGGPGPSWYPGRRRFLSQLPHRFYTCWGGGWRWVCCGRRPRRGWRLWMAVRPAVT